MSEPVLVGGATPTDGNKRLIVLGAVAAVLLLLALVLPKVLFGGADLAGDELPPPLVTAPVEGATAEPVVADDAPIVPDAGVEPASTFEVFSTKNPFTPLRDVTPAATATGDATTVAPAPTTGTDPTTTPTTPGPSTGTSVPFASTSPTTVTPSVEPVRGQRVALLEVYVDDASQTVATVRVNDTVHEVAQGVTFANRYRAVTLSVADGCGQFLYGDADFRLCEGEELLK